MKTRNTNLKLDLFMAKLINQNGLNFEDNKDYIESIFVKETYSSITSSYSFIYPWTNELLKKYYDVENLSKKKVLTIDGSGDHTIHAAIAGARQIDAVDTNSLAKYYSALKIALIKALSYNEFKKSFKNCDKKDEILLNGNFNPNKIKKYLTEQEFTFWSELLKITNNDFENLFCDDTLVSCEDACIYFDKEMYYKAKNALLESKINHYTLDITNSDSIKNLGKYDAILLSNVLEWEKEKYDEFRKYISDSLNQDGILCCYHMVDPIKKYNFENLDFVKSVVVDSDIYPERGITIYKKQ